MADLEIYNRLSEIQSFESFIKIHNGHFDIKTKRSKSKFTIVEKLEKYITFLNNQSYTEKYQRCFSIDYAPGQEPYSVLFNYAPTFCEHIILQLYIWMNLEIAGPIITRTMAHLNNRDYFSNRLKSTIKDYQTTDIQTKIKMRAMLKKYIKTQNIEIYARRELSDNILEPYLRCRLLYHISYLEERYIFPPQWNYIFNKKSWDIDKAANIIQKYWRRHKQKQ